MSRFWNENTKKIKPYVAGEQPKEGSFIKLNTNENPYPPTPMVAEKLKNLDINRLRLYPNSEGAIVKKAVSGFYGIAENQVFVGNGSDEVLAFLFKAFFDSTTKIAFPDITYSFYPVYCSLFDIPYVTVPVKEDFSIDLGNYPNGLRGVIFANPNAPTGLCISRDSIEDYLNKHPDTLVVVDEAYVDFGAETCVPLISKNDNLIVVQTLSKSRSLAGCRIGIAMGQSSLMEGLSRVKDSFNSYPLDTIAQISAEAAFMDVMYFNETRERIIKTRDWTREQLMGFGIKVTDSKANFLFVSIPGVKGPDALQQLRQQGILVRNFNVDRISDWLRITIGTPEDMKLVVKAIKKIMAG